MRLCVIRHFACPFLSVGVEVEREGGGEGRVYVRRELCVCVGGEGKRASTSLALLNVLCALTFFFLSQHECWPQGGVALVRHVDPLSRNSRAVTDSIFKTGTGQSVALRALPLQSGVMPFQLLPSRFIELFSLGSNLVTNTGPLYFYCLISDFHYNVTKHHPTLKCFCKKHGEQICRGEILLYGKQWN